MNSIEPEIERRLRSASARLKGENEMADLVMSRLERADIVHPRPRSSRHWLTASIAAAAVICLIATIWFVTAGSASLAYAQVTKAMADVKSARLDVTQPTPDGKRVELATYFYERGVGLRMEGALNGTPFLFIDNGQRQWTRTGADGDLQESEGTGMRDLFAEVLLARDMLEGARRDPAGDETIDGFRCRMFAKPAKGDVIASRVWLDEQDRVRKLETGTLTDGKWTIRQTVVAHHDVPIDRAMFQPPAAQSKPAEPAMAGDLDQRISRTFSLDRALAKTEVLGLVLAVHDVRGGADGSLLVLTSLRPTSETMKKYGTGLPGWHPLGDHELGAPDQYIAVPVGEFHSRRLYARWDLFVPRKPAQDAEKALSLTADVYTRDELYEANEREKKQWYTNDLELPPVAVPTETLTFDQVVAACWTQARAIHSLFTPVTFWESVKVVPGKGRVADSHRLENWTPEQLRSELATEIERRRNFRPTTRK